MKKGPVVRNTVILIVAAMFALVSSRYWLRPSVHESDAHAESMPVPYNAYAARPRDVVTAAYQFSAAHPEIVSYVPCFCGCAQGGHRHVGDCFVSARSVDGRVTKWNDHGVHCAVCIDLVVGAERMLKAGQTVEEIRATIDKQFVGAYPIVTHTPYPPSGQ